MQLFQYSVNIFADGITKWIIFSIIAIRSKSLLFQ
jgi:hypothetical protein